MNSEIGIVWFKRDLRLTDHAPLDAAEQSGLPLLYLWILEPSEWAAPENSLRHWQFQWHSIQQINQILEQVDRKITTVHANALDVFTTLLEQFTVRKVWSYQEAGTPRTFERDAALKKRLKNTGVVWQEFQRDGIIRGLKDRKNWDRAWFGYVNSPIIENTFEKGRSVEWEHHFQLPESHYKQIQAYNPLFQRPDPSTPKNI